MSQYSNFSDNYFDNKRRELLTTIYGKDYTRAEGIYKEVGEKIDKAHGLSEVDQKTINQMQHAFNRFKEEIQANCNSGVIGTYHHIRKRMAEIVKAQTRNVSYVSYDDWAANLGIDDTQVETMLGTVTTLQMTMGCTNYCRRCNEWALPFVRKHFTFNTVKHFLDNFFKNGNSSFSLYNASDPLDWKHQDKNIIDITAYMAEKGYRLQYGLLTKVPKGTEEIAEDLLINDADIGVSITKKNRSKVAMIEERAGRSFDVQHDVDQLEIPAGLDEDFSEIKSSITDNYGTEITPEGAFIIIPTFTSALNPTGQCRIKVNSETQFFLDKKVGRDAWPVEYFKPLNAIDLNGREFTLEVLLDAQIENILQDKGSIEATPPGMMTLSEYFKTFEPAAAKRRKSLLPSIVKEYRQKILFGEDRDPAYRQMRFREKVKQYIAFCRMERVVEFKKYAFSYFLKSIADYVKHHPVEREIILHLRKKETEMHHQRFDKLFIKSSVPTDRIVDEFENDPFILFQSMMFRLLKNSDNTIIHDFINQYPSCYDPETDRFVGIS